MLEEHQRKEARRAEKLLEKQQALAFRDKVRHTASQKRASVCSLRYRPVPYQVLEAEFCAQQNIAPFLKYPVLRKIVQTFTNDEHEDFGRWANNPLAIQMLQQARDLLDSGRATEAEMEAHLLSQLQAGHPPGSCAVHLACKSLLSTALPTGAGERGAPAGGQQAGAHRAPGDRAAGAGPERTRAPASAGFQALQAMQAGISRSPVVSAVQLEERRKGNEHFRAERWAAALGHYERAQSIVELVRGASPPDQAEVDRNRVSVALNAAAAHLALHQHADAVRQCTAALGLDKDNLTALRRRGKALSLLHEYAVRVLLHEWPASRLCCIHRADGCAAGGPARLGARRCAGSPSGHPGTAGSAATGGPASEGPRAGAAGIWWHLRQALIEPTLRREGNRRDSMSVSGMQ